MFFLLRKVYCFMSSPFSERFVFYHIHIKVKENEQQQKLMADQMETGDCISHLKMFDPFASIGL